MNNTTSSTSFTKYQIFVIAILAILQFTLILDFMVLSPLGAILMKELSIQPSQFGLVVSAYAFSAGASGLLAAGFADKFDRKKLLLFFYVGFVFGTILCALATTYEFLLIARIVTGIFGGVIGSISFAIISDLFKLEFRGRVMGFVQMAFAASQILGLPIGLLLANEFGWHSPFWMIAGFSVLVGIAIVVYMKPINAHLDAQNDRNALQHLWKTLSNTEYIRAFLATILLATGGFMLMPFGSAFSINNLKIRMEDLPILYGVTGVFSILFGPLSGKLSDRFGKYKMFVIGSVLTIIMVAIYTNLNQTPLWIVIIINILMFAGITARMIPASALMTAIPEQHDRGAFMSINSSIQQISGGAASALAGVIVTQGSNGTMQNYPLLGYVVVASMVITIFMLYILNKQVHKKIAKDSKTN
ncbi:Purine efflux pump PbuE [Emticicia aquatica]|jgi:predicted MFS family arabinose efflux permease|uniref:Purine efflux pump PbuE n=1 Tax=Emticicia aquatica TaxID=1681835 RepID=A0ABN8EVN0_9BACT|nr:MFS transporter [Emticicia aquatica]CAH0997089.1 Purine efflux pump PbuE [Emticicia aquatica]